MGSKGLNNVQEYVFRQSWQNRSYAKMATETRYDETYLKYVGFKLWKLLSEVMQQEVTKSNLQAAVERYGRTLSHSIPSRLDDSLANPAELSLVSESLAEPLEQEPPETTHDLTSPVDAITIATLEKALSQSQQDWGEAMDVSQFYGRVEELTQLMQWVRQDGCRLVAVQGMGGIGKSSLSIKAGQQLAMERGGSGAKG
ncbi:MAG: ATP-binding protein [Leptolyngbyaceae cyanobacterium CRU_2_3]|nr:ATP-binding protein [Leptolyngbyaceae cyanobacterium CRU_2_3]